MKRALALATLLAWVSGASAAGHHVYRGQSIVAIRPLPVNAEATIVVWSKGSAEGYFELYTLRGIRVARSPIQFFDGSGYVGLPQNLSWTPANLRPGIYLLRLSADDHSVSTFRWIQR